MRGGCVAEDGTLGPSDLRRRRTMAPTPSRPAPHIIWVLTTSTGVVAAAAVIPAQAPRSAADGGEIWSPRLSQKRVA